MLANSLLLCASMNLRKYQEDPAHCGIVSVSLFAGVPHTGHVVLTQSVIFARGLSPVSVGSYSATSGSRSGKSSSFIGTHPHLGQFIIGIGSPQNLCLLKIQSLIL